MSKKHSTPEIPEDVLEEGLQHVKAAITPRSPRRMGEAPHTVHGLDCECTDAEIRHTLTYVAAMVHDAPTSHDQGKGKIDWSSIDWAALVPMVLQIISIFKRSPAPGT